MAAAALPNPRADALADLQRRTLAVVVASQVLGGAGLAAGITVGALLAQDMLGDDSLSGLPVALFTLGSALAAFLIGRITQTAGRRRGLGLGFAAGGIGAAGVVLAAVADNIPLLFASLFVYGAGTASNLQARYAGADLASPARRGTAVSIALVATTIGAVAGPNLVQPMGRFAEGLGIPPLAGPFLLAGVAYLAAGGILFALLRPDPFLVAQQVAVRAAAKDGTPAVGPAAPLGSGVLIGATAMVLTQIAMVAIMTMTPVHMRAHGYGLGEVGLVIGIHVGAMYLPSLLTGALVDRVGRIPMTVAAAGTLLLAGLTAAFAPMDSLGLLILALGLLGLGWNFGLIAGTALVVDGTVPANRARTQGSIDVLIAISGAGGGVLSGVLMAGTSYATLSLAGGAISLLLIPTLFWARRAYDGGPAQQS
ncbi:MFS transporter [Tomitella biformata]|uniref:MFS transporter n=1 Tax=Tomitella biformata TaxID=630403 RepID=UPI0004B83E41|nr:MFS transporter [Tomitella biformata]